MSELTARRIRDVYDARSQIPFDGSSNRAEVNAAVNLVERSVPDRTSLICDVGCGAGWHLLELASRNYERIVGIDLSAAALLSGSGMCRIWPATLVQGDVADWGVRGYFDLAASFNACVGAFDRGQDAGFLEGIWRILKRDGLLLMTFLSSEVAARREGDYSVQYCADTPVDVRSSVRFDHCTRRFGIMQRVGELPIPEEQFCVYSESEMRSEVTLRGFEVLDCGGAGTASGDHPLAYVSVLVARKRLS